MVTSASAPDPAGTGTTGHGDISGVVLSGVPCSRGPLHTLGEVC
jgi:hypothetical protein